MRLRTSSPSAVILALLSFLLPSLAADLTPLSKGRNVHLAMVGHGPLCDGKVEQHSPDVVTVRLSKTTSECGSKGELIRISKEDAVEIEAQERLTKRRVAAKLLVGIAGIAALSAVPLTTSDPENWLLVANWVVPAFIMYGGWKVVPRRRDYLLLMTCPDSLHCFSEVNRSK